MIPPWHDSYHVVLFGYGLCALESGMKRPNHTDTRQQSTDTVQKGRVCVVVFTAWSAPQTLIQN